MNPLAAVARARRPVVTSCLGGLLAFAVWGLVPVRAQDGPGTEAAVAAGAESETQTVRGVVAFVDPNGAYFQLLVNGSVRGFRVLAPQQPPDFGMEAEVDYQDSTRTNAGWDAAAIRVRGAGTFPVPKKATPDDMMGGRFNTEWVEVEGVVLQAKYAMGVLTVHLAGKGGWGIATVYRWPAAKLGNDWWGAHLRLRGINLGHGQNAFRVHSPDLLTVVKPGLASPFDFPESDPAAVAALPAPSPERVKFPAVVLAYQDGMAFLRSGNTAFQADILYPFDPRQDPSGYFLDTPKIPYLDRGDQVVITGSPLQVRPWLRMNFSQFRIVKRGGTVAPRQLTLEEVASGKAPNDLVTLRGRLVSVHETPTGNRRRETLELSADGRVIDAIHDSVPGGKLRAFAVDDMVEVTGIVEPAPGTPPWIVRLAKPTDAVSHGMAPEAAAERLRQRLKVGFGSGAALLGLGALFFWRHRRHQVKERRVLEENTILEQRVADRTVELEATREELARALEQERELGELKSRFVTMVSHEFRTPLGVIMSAVELLRHYEERLPEGQKKELLDDIHQSTRGMGGLMEQVLVLGRVEAGTVGYRPGPCDLRTLLEKVSDESLSATDRRCPIRCQIDGELPPCEADETIVRHVVANLLSNAVKYSPAGSEVTLSCRRDEQEAVICVEDRGIGIPAEEQPHLFEAFHRCSNVSEIPGTGLGLVIVKRCVDLHGGRLHVDSAVGRGTAFTVRLPVWRQAPSESGAVGA